MQKFIQVTGLILGGFGLKMRVARSRSTVSKGAAAHFMRRMEGASLPHRKVPDNHVGS
jgi:hypothetical protein